MWGRELATGGKGVLAELGQPAGGALVSGEGVGLSQVRETWKTEQAGSRTQWSGSKSSTQGQTPGSLSHTFSPKRAQQSASQAIVSEGVAAPPGLDSCRGTGSRAQRRESEPR